MNANGVISYAARALALAACVGLAVNAASAQESINQASISGRVVDQQGLVVPGVRVVAVQTETNLTAEGLTDRGGRFRFAETSAVSGQGMSVGSQRNLSNNFVVDGLSANDDAAGLTRNGNFGAGSYPTSPSQTFSQITASADPRTFQFALRVTF
ncbi:MAG: carboxypeptidase regulatory-like domain-containing protein [Vicinamibacterales bacterium]